MRRIDGYLSRKAQDIEPTALVWCDEFDTEQEWSLESEVFDPVGLGDSFGMARQALTAWMHSQRAKR